jgi:glycerophosphoryl diester phosphodiesterase
VLIVAHRGAAGAAPENTLASVERALADGTDWVEIDVQETRDGQVVVVHDSDFMKLAGDPLKVWEGDLAQVRALDVGRWFDPGFAGQRVPLLGEVLDAVRGRARLVIELKYYGHDQRLEQRVVDLVEDAGMADQVAIMSLKLPGVQKVQALRPGWHTGLLAATSLGDLSRLDVDFLAVNANMASPGFIRRAHRAGKRVLVWTVNDALSLSKWMSAGVDGVITDEPALARSILQQRAGLSSVERLLLSAALLFGKPQVVNRYRDNSP